MQKKKLIFFGTLVGIVVALSGYFAFYQARNNTAQNLIDPTFDLGFTYVNLSPRQAAELGVNSGALVTRVVPGSPAESAGITVDDVICAFNGVRVEDETPLYGMMRCCTVDTVVEMQVWHQQVMKTVTLVNAGVGAE